MTKTHRRPVRAGAIEFEPLDTNNKKTAKGRSSEFWSHLFPTVAEKGSKYHQRQQHKTSHPLHPCFSAVTGPAAVAERAIMCCYSRDATQCSLLQWDHGFSCISIPKCTGILKSVSKDMAFSRSTSCRVFYLASAMWWAPALQAHSHGKGGEGAVRGAATAKLLCKGD